MGFFSEYISGNVVDIADFPNLQALPAWSVDTLIATQPISEDFWDEARRVLKQCGVLIVAGPNDLARQLPHYGFAMKASKSYGERIAYIALRA